MSIGPFERRVEEAIKVITRDVQEYARTHHKYKTHTSNLEGATEKYFEGSGTCTRGIVYLDTNKAPYAPYVHNGTAAHIIVPRRKKSLRWASNGRFVFARRVSHPGYAGDDFLYRAYKAYRPKAVKILKAYIDQGLREGNGGAK